MNKLKPCPFCGGEAEVVEEAYDLGKTAFAVYCSGTCHVKLGVAGRLCEDYIWTPTFDTEAEAIEAWNTRAERTVLTCTKETAGEGETHWYRCSNCKHAIDPRAYFCSLCGAKVVSEHGA